MFDQNGWEFFETDFRHLSQGDWLYIWSKSKDFSYKSLLDMFYKV